MARGRGVDFEHRFTASRWAEDLLIRSISACEDLLAVRFGLSEVKREEELVYGLTDFKEPDLLCYKRSNLTPEQIGLLTNAEPVGVPREEFQPGGRFEFAFRRALCAIEVEFSPYKASTMSGRHWQPRSEEAWDRRPLKHAKPPTAPNIWVKEEDLPKLAKWEQLTQVPILVVHVFDEEAFAVRLRTVIEFDNAYLASRDQKKLQVTRGIFRLVGPYSRVDVHAAGQEKMVYVITPAAAVLAGRILNVEVASQLGVSTTGKYVSQVLFRGGALEASAAFLALLGDARGAAGVRG